MMKRGQFLNKRRYEDRTVRRLTLIRADGTVEDLGETVYLKQKLAEVLGLPYRVPETINPQEGQPQVPTMMWVNAESYGTVVNELASKMTGFVLYGDVVTAISVRRNNN